MTRTSFKTLSLGLVALACLFGGASSARAQTTTTYGSGGSSNTFTGGTINPGDTVLLNDGASVTGNVTANGTLQFNQSAGNTLTISNLISGTGTLSLTNTGILNLAGTSGGEGVENTVVLDMTTSASLGVLQINSAIGDLWVGGNGTGTLNVTGGYVSNANGKLGVNPGSIGTATVSNGTWANSGELGVGLNGTGTLNVSGGNVSSNSGLVGYARGSNGTATVSGGTWANSTDLFVGFFGTGTLNVTGGYVSNANGYLGVYAGSVGTATVSSGTWANSGSLNVTGTLIVNGGSVTNTDGVIAFNPDTIGTVTVSSGTWANSGSLAVGSYGTGTLTISGGLVSVAGTLTKENGTINLNSGGTLQIGVGGSGGQLDVSALTNNGMLIFNRSDASTYGGDIVGTGNLMKLGAGALTLFGSNSFAGDTLVSSGTLILDSANALGPKSAVTVASGATLQANKAIRIGYIESEGTVNGGENLTATLTVTRSGNIGGIANGSDGQGSFAAGIVKLGTGTSTVNAANTYTGLTWVREGELVTGLANAFAAASDLTLDSGATLDRAGYSTTVTNATLNGTVSNSSVGGLLTVTGTLSGSGSVTGDVLVTGVHAPGNSPGIQTFDGNLTYDNAAVIYWELTANTQSNSPVVYDQIVLSNAANLSFGGSNVLSLLFAGAGSLVDWTDSFWEVNRAWTVFDLASGVTTGFSNLSLGGSLLDANGLTLDPGTRGYFSLDQSGQDVTLRFTAVPEPSTYAMALAGLACGGWQMWRRRRLRQAATLASTCDQRFPEPAVR
jgi:T5SS/PEP-CTERM-associated repeat protein/autotransporter-associated beta strand protein